MEGRLLVSAVACCNPAALSAAAVGDRGMRVAFEAWALRIFTDHFPLPSCDRTVSPQPLSVKRYWPRVDIQAVPLADARRPVNLGDCLGGGTIVARRFFSSMGVKANAVVPSESGLRTESTTRPSPAWARRSRENRGLSAI